MLRVLWSARKIESSFPLKEKVTHQSCVIYVGVLLEGT